MKWTGLPNLRRLFLGYLLIFLALAIWGLPHAARADDVAQGFKASGNLKVGELVALDVKKLGTVYAVPANQSNLIYGVIIDSSKAPVTISQPGQQVYVAAAGDYPVLASTENGPIASGDYLSISGTDGIAAKATPDQPYIVGHATVGFNGTSGVVGHAGKYPIGKIAASLTITRNPLFKNTLAIPGPLQKIGNSIAGKEVSPFRVYVALVLFIVAAAFVIILLTVGIRSAMIAMGRNPLSKPLIMRGMIEVITLGAVIFIASLVGVYLILKL